jgi:ribose transport system ATP-binding protein
VPDVDVLSGIFAVNVHSNGSAFPPKTDDGKKGVIFPVKSLSGRGFHDVSFEVARGQIIGVAGVEGNGQSELMLALAELQPSEGSQTMRSRAR